MPEFFIEFILRTIIGSSISFLGGKIIKKVFTPKYQNNPIPEIYGVDILNVLIEERNIQASEIKNIFGSDLRYHLILKGGEMTTSEVQKLSKFFKISPSVFFQKIKYN